MDADYIMKNGSYSLFLVRSSYLTTASYSYEFTSFEWASSITII